MHFIERKRGINGHLIPDMQVVRAAFERLSQRKMLGALLDEFLGMSPSRCLLFAQA